MNVFDMVYKVKGMLTLRVNVFKKLLAYFGTIE